MEGRSHRTVKVRRHACMHIKLKKVTCKIKALQLYCMHDSCTCLHLISNFQMTSLGRDRDNQRAECGLGGYKMSRSGLGDRRNCCRLDNHAKETSAHRGKEGIGNFDPPWGDFLESKRKGREIVLVLCLVEL